MKTFDEAANFNLGCPFYKVNDTRNIYNNNIKSYILHNKKLQAIRNIYTSSKEHQR